MAKPFAVLRLSSPAAKDAAGGELVLNKIAEEDAVLAVFSCDVGDEKSDAVINVPLHADLPRRPGADRFVPAGDAVNGVIRAAIRAGKIRTHHRGGWQRGLRNPRAARF
jgi:hypothetical protein